MSDMSGRTIRPLQLSSISSSYSLGGCATTGNVLPDATTEVGASLVASTLPSSLLAASSVDEDTDEFDRMEAEGDGNDSREHEQRNNQLPQPYHTATEVDPYALATDSRSTLYPSGLIGLAPGDENSRDSNPDEPATGSGGDESAHTDHYPADSLNREDAEMYADAHGEEDGSGRFVDGEMPEGWVGSFREQNDDDEAYQQQREAEDQAERAQFAEPADADADRPSRKRRRDEYDDAGSGSGSETGSSRSDDDDDGQRDDRRSDSDEDRANRERDAEDPYGNGSPQPDGAMDQTDATTSLYPAQPANSAPYLPPPLAPAAYAPATPISQHRNNFNLQYGSAYPTTPATSHLLSHYNAPNPSASSPMYAYSPHHTASFSPSPHLGPTSPRVGPSSYYSSIPYGSTSAGASSPRQDTIASVTHRIEYMQRSGRLNHLLQNAARFNQEVSGYTTSTAPVPDYHNLTSQAGAAKSSSKQALISIDQHLLRRYIFNVLDSDMIIRGVVVNKNQTMGLVINIAQILWPVERAREVLTKQQQAAQQMIATLQGQKDSDKSATRHPTAVHCFPPLSSFLGGIHSSGSPTAVPSNFPSVPSTQLDTTYATEMTLFANFEVLAIQGECHLAEMHAPAPSKPDAGTAATLTPPPTASLERFALGDQVKALVISVDIHSEKVYLSMNQNRLRGSVAATHKLGVVQKEMPKPDPPQPPADSSFASMIAKLKPDLQEKISSFGSSTPVAPIPPPSPAPAATSTSSWSYNSFLKSNGNTTPTHPSVGSSLLPAHLLKARAALNPKLHPSAPSLSLLSNPLLLSKAKNFLAYLRDTPLFKNPEGVNKLTSCYHINQYGSLRGKLTLDQANLYKNLRHAQNQSWAKESVVKGISLAKKGSYDNAMKCYKHALDIEPNFTQAYVARGAAYVLQGMLKKAIVEFEQALRIDPQQPYALTYLQAAKDKLNGRSPATTGSHTPNHAPNEPSTTDTARGVPGESKSSSHSRSRDRNSAGRSRDRRSSEEKKCDRRSSSDRHKTSKRSKRRRTESNNASHHTTVVDLAHSSSSSSDSSPSPSRTPTGGLPSTDPLVRQQEEVARLVAKASRKKEREQKKQRKDERKAERKQRKKHRKEERRHSSSKRQSTRDESTGPSDRSRSTSHSSVGERTANANPEVSYGTSVTPPLATAHSSLETGRLGDSGPGSSADQPLTLQSDDDRDDWFGEPTSKAVSSMRVAPSPIPQRVEIVSPDLSIATSDGPVTPFLVPDHANPFASMFTIPMPSPPNDSSDQHAFQSPNLHLPGSFSSSSLSGFVLSPTPSASEAFVNPFASNSIDTKES